MYKQYILSKLQLYALLPKKCIMFVILTDILPPKFIYSRFASTYLHSNMNPLNKKPNIMFFESL